MNKRRTRRPRRPINGWIQAVTHPGPLTRAEVALFRDARLRQLYGALTNLAALEDGTEVNAITRNGAVMGYRLQRGELVYGHRHLARVSGLHYSTVRRKLFKLVDLGLARYERDTRYYTSIVSVTRLNDVSPASEGGAV